MQYGLAEEHLTGIKEILKRSQRVRQAVLFGSRAKGTSRPGSDIDIALQGKELNLQDLLAISNDLDELWLPYRIDLTIYDRLTDPNLIDHINRIGKPLL